MGLPAADWRARMPFRRAAGRGGAAVGLRPHPSRRGRFTFRVCPVRATPPERFCRVKTAADRRYGGLGFTVADGRRRSAAAAIMTGSVRLTRTRKTGETGAAQTSGPPQCGLFSDGLPSLMLIIRTRLVVKQIGMG